MGNSLQEIGARLKAVRKALDLTQEAFAEKLTVNSKSTVSAYERGEMPIAKKAEVELFSTLGINKIWLQTGFGDMFDKTPIIKSEAFPLGAIDDEQFEKAGNNKEFLDLGAGNLIMRVPLIQNHAAYCGYLKGHADPEWIEDQPKHDVPVTQRHRGEYYAFIARGDSMNSGAEDSIAEGDTVTGRVIDRKYWKDKFHLKSYSKFIIVHMEGILIKEIALHDVKNGILTLHSTNTDREAYPDIVISLEQVDQILNITHVTKNTNGRKGNVADVNTSLTKSNIKELEKEVISQSTKKKIQVFVNNGTEINKSYFDSIVPTVENKKGWQPYFNSIYELLNQYPTPEALLNDQNNNFWPMTALPDEMMRTPHTVAHAIVAGPPHNNMNPAITPFARLGIIFRDKEDWNEINWGRAHLVVYNNKQKGYSCHYIKKGKAAKHFLLKNANPDYSDNDKEVSIDEIFAIFEIVSVNNPSPGL